MTGGSSVQPGDDVAARYSRRYGAAVTRLLATEGGFVDDPNDRGGATKYGISLRFLVAEEKIDPSIVAAFDLDHSGDIDGADIRQLTMSDAVSFYWRFFWQPVHCESFPEPIGEMLFDQAVNDGAGPAKKLLQQAINACAVHIPGVPRLTIDGAIGDQSRSAMAAVLEHPGLGMAALAEAYREAARARYRAIVAESPSQAKFLKGWLARADELGVGW